jgi:hypothetical protein
MVFMGLVGMRFDAEGVRFRPCVPKGISRVELRNIAYSKMTLDISIRGTGTNIKQVLVDNKESADGFLAAQDEGHRTVSITVGQE